MPVLNVFEQLEEVVVTAGGIAREKGPRFRRRGSKGASIKESGESNIVSGISAKVVVFK